MFCHENELKNEMIVALVAPLIREEEGRGVSCFMFKHM